MKLIDKDTLVAKIESRISDIKMSQRVGLIKKRDAEKKIALFKSILSLINTFEVKEVNLEKEAERFVQTKEFIESTESPAILLAKHFYSLGLKTQKGK